MSERVRPRARIRDEAVGNVLHIFIHNLSRASARVTIAAAAAAVATAA